MNAPSRLEAAPGARRHEIGAPDREVTPRDRWAAAAELLIAAALVYAANVLDVVPVNETPWLVAIGWVSLRSRGRGWRDLGLRRPPSWLVTVAVALIAAVALQLADEFVTTPLVERLTGERPDLSSFRPLVGNLPLALIMLVAIWTLAAFGEELAYRGYMLDRAATLGRRSPAAYVVAVVVISLLFGLGHYYQGAAGMAGSTVSGLLFGTLYLASRRNLWLPILAHGFSDTIGLALIYFGFFVI